MAAWRGEHPKVSFAYEPCARQHVQGRVCILPDGHKEDQGNPIARHLSLCESARQMPGSERGITCDHDFWWGLSLAEQAYLNNKI